MKIRQQKILTWLVLFFMLASNFISVIQPITAYAENGIENSLVDDEQVDQSIDTTDSQTTETSTEELETPNELEAAFPEPVIEKDSLLEEESTEENTEQERSGAELAARADPYSVEGLTDAEIIALANHMYGSYASVNPTFEVHVTNDQGVVLNIPFARARGVGSVEKLIPMSYSVKLDQTWLIIALHVEKFRIDGGIAYCVQPGVEFGQGEGYVPHPSIGLINENQKQIINNIINFGSNGNDSDELYMATQFYIWEALGYTVQSDLANYAAYKSQIDARADNHRTKPSFDNQEITVKAGETVQLNDSKNVFNYYHEIRNDGNTSVSKDGNTLKITPSINSNDGEIVFQRNSPVSGVQYFWVKENAQTMTTAGEAQPTQTKIRVKVVKTGSAAAQKLDEEGNPLADAVFRFEYDGIVEERTTGEDGLVKLDDILMGTSVTITEIRAPEGRVIDNIPQTVVIEPGQTITKTFTNRWAQQPIKLIKREKDANRPLKDVPFALYKLTGVTKTLIGEYKTDANGEINIERLLYNRDGYRFVELEPLHGFLPNTTEYDFNVTVENDGKLIELIVDNEPNPVVLNTTATGKNGEKFVDPTKEIELEDTIHYKWLFAGRTYQCTAKIVDQETGEVLETLQGSFVPPAYEGFYVVKTTVDGNKYRGKKLVFYEYIYDTVSKKEVAKHEDINDEGQSIKVNDPKITTKAQGEDGRQQFNPLTKVPVKETASFTDLVVGHKYTTTVQAYRLNDNTPYDDALETKTFIATSPTMEVTFDFILDGKDLQGNGLVFTEKLFYENEEVANHEDLENEDQTVSFTDPEISTKAHGKDKQQKFDPLAKIPIKETAVFTDLIIGDEYKVIVQGYRLSTGEPYEKVRAEAVFTATEAKMSYSFDFVLSGKELAGDGIVFTEKLLFNDEVIAEHNDLTNKKQTIQFTDPKITTLAQGKNGEKILVPAQNTTIQETAKITGLIIGHKYTVNVNGHRLSDGRVIDELTKQKTFIAEKTEITLSFEYQVDGQLFSNDGIVFTETLLTENEVIAEHLDLENEKQTVRFKPLVNNTSTLPATSGPRSSLPSTGENGSENLALFALFMLILCVILQLERRKKLR
ncbi:MULTISPECIES: VaFE repeat-containing surface-anchored protein [unclassified Enterococcus]|uniref:VaFE repeat-containing surface-anchored protein n=1 Tax=unclassified Enterococcus TaxID=2608891 RepID=UPI001CE1F3A1|nr:MULTISPECIES: VaFE repeat-containing surface-anchored protein [unclassified Enterococcus]MCA5012991.1 VaFE repeat-containing surface-anchored protein [Enterococcus sp. S23]MCA5016242.1 VaFE repeat-containing surface-anchored protein [Enterococcus sp. S22(2020)]